MIIAFGGTFFFIFILFEALGIGDVVWPILFPILSTTFGIMILVMVILGFACRVGNESTSDQQLSLQSYLEPTFPTYESISTGAVYVIPVYCPHCQNKLELDRVEWIGSSEFSCPNCYRMIQTGVRENI